MIDAGTQQKLCKVCPWRSKLTDNKLCTFNSCVFRATGNVYSEGRYTYTEFADRMTGGIVLVEAVREPVSAHA